MKECMIELTVEEGSNTGRVPEVEEDMTVAESRDLALNTTEAGSEASVAVASRIAHLKDNIRQTAVSGVQADEALVVLRVPMEAKTRIACTDGRTTGRIAALIVLD